MDSGRLGACHRLTNKRRKFLVVINDVMKYKFDVSAAYIKNAHMEAEDNFEKSCMYMRRELAHQNVLQKCMKMRRCNLDRRNVFGCYEGKTIKSFGRDVENFIAYNHPKMRQKRYLQNLLNKSLEQGAILKENIVKDRIAGWIERSCTKYKLVNAHREKSVLKSNTEERKKKRDQRSIPKLPSLLNPFYFGPRDVDSDTNQEISADVLKLTDDIGKLEINMDTDQHVSEVVDATKAIQTRTAGFNQIDTRIDNHITPL